MTCEELALNSGLLIALKMEAASTSEESVKFYQTTQRNNSYDGHLHIEFTWEQ
jgi:hypothetical protein